MRGEVKRPKKLVIEKYECAVDDQCQMRCLQLVRALPPHTKVFEDSSSSGSMNSSTGSCLTNIFSELVYDKKFESLNKTKRLYGKDLYGAFRFSNEFKRAIGCAKTETEERVRGAENGRAEIGNEESSNLRSEPSAQEESRRQKFTFSGFDFRPEDENDEERRGGTRGEGCRSRRGSEETFWRMLSVDEKFRISPPWYDAYGEGKRQETETTAASSEAMEISRLKCLEWLENYFHDPSPQRRKR